MPLVSQPDLVHGLHEVLDLTAELRPKQLAAVDGASKVSYYDLVRSSQKLAVYLASHGSSISS